MNPEPILPQSDDTDPFADEYIPYCYACGDEVTLDVECVMNLCEACIAESEYKAFQTEQAAKINAVKSIARLGKDISPYVPSELKNDWNVAFANFLIVYRDLVNGLNG